jgi:DNA-binding cell septation regulator SpoVG
MPNMRMMIIVTIHMYEYLNIGSTEVLEESGGSFLSVPSRLKEAFKFSGFLKRQGNNTRKTITCFG